MGNKQVAVVTHNKNKLELLMEVTVFQYTGKKVEDKIFLSDFLDDLLSFGEIIFKAINHGNLSDVRK